MGVGGFGHGRMQQAEGAPAPLDHRFTNEKIGSFSVAQQGESIVKPWIRQKVQSTFSCLLKNDRSGREKEEKGGRLDVFS